jgi:pimeloyl-ACP methyl ester carboxylesterase
LCLCHRFRGTIDDWDPALLDALTAERDVIVFDGPGVGYSSGEVPSTVTEMADGVVGFLEALGVDETDLLGWSMGGFVAQALGAWSPRDGASADCRRVKTGLGARRAGG